MALVHSDSMSSLGPNVWNIMPVSTVNALSSSQLQGLTNSQVNGILNSPNYSSFSSAVKSYTAAAADPTKAQTSTQIESSASKLSSLSACVVLCITALSVLLRI